MMRMREGDNIRKTKRSRVGLVDEEGCEIILQGGRLGVLKPRWMNGWKETRSPRHMLRERGDVVVWKDAKWCISQLVSGRGKEETAE